MKKLLLALLVVPAIASVQACPNDPYAGEYTNSVYNDSVNAAEEKVVSNGVEYKGEELQPLVFVNESPTAAPEAAEPVTKVEEKAFTIQIEPKEKVKTLETKAPEVKPVDELLLEEIILTPKDASKADATGALVAVTKEKTDEDKLLEEIKLELEKLDAADAGKTTSIFDEEVEVTPAGK